jgi:phospholipid-binding lipoprotein MlaA
MRGTALAAIVGAMVIGGGSIASADTPRTPGDPWEGWNRTAYAIEGELDHLFFHPISEVFKHLAPGPIGRSVHNVIVNLSEPNVFVNDVLQGRVKRAIVPARRFLTNTTIGILGLFDVAAKMGVIHHDNEFGVTLGTYGVGPGPYMYVPLIGPGTVRDLIGSAVDGLIDPIHWARYANRPELSIVRAVVGGLDERVATEAQLDALLSDAADPYATLRSVYLQNKESEIRGESAPLDNLPSFDVPAVTAPPAPATAGASPVTEDAPPATPAAPAAVSEPAAAPADPTQTPQLQTPSAITP